MNAKNILTVQAVLLVLLIVVVVLGFALPYVIPPRTASVSALATDLPIEVPISTVTSMPIVSTSWEYLSVDYSQHQILETLFESNAEVYRYEIINAPEPYRSTFLGILTADCTLTQDIIFDTEAQKCVGRNFIGRENILSALGQDGWELIQIDNQSTEYTYQIDMLFKRPVNP